MISQDPQRAARQAIDSLNVMNEARKQWVGFKDDPFYKNKPPITQGVAKLGWSWEALDVRKWTNEQNLANAMVDIGEQRGSKVFLFFFVYCI